ncbi:pyridoxamine 5'-phosphate oxidase family protein [Sphaerisporangium sp. B11E5]|uniref:pyridoxamine 5'-phosphate oxidase family protein n=1 Tax=Sphaerisporangium sp. B11E5 TaxID=3153563 RepID=UPI00325DC0FB
MGDDDTAPVLRELDAEECRRLLDQGVVGRVGFTGPDGPVVLPVNYTMCGDTVLFRTGFGGPMDEDLDTGVAGVELKVAFEVDHIDTVTREGWSVLVQGAAHRVTSEEELATVRATAVEPWPGGERRLYVRVVPTRITGRRVQAG